MALLTIVYDPCEPPLRFSVHGDVRLAQLPLAAGLADLDIYEVARRLAALLLEQIALDAAAGNAPQ